MFPKRLKIARSADSLVRELLKPWKMGKIVPFSSADKAVRAPFHSRKSALAGLLRLGQPRSAARLGRYGVLGLDQSFGEGVPGKSGDLMDVQFIHGALAMLLDGFDADFERFRYFAVGQARSDELEHFDFALSKITRGIGYAIEESAVSLAVETPG